MGLKSKQDTGVLRQFIAGAARNRLEHVQRLLRRNKLEKHADERPHAALIFNVEEPDGIGAAVAARAASAGMTAYVCANAADKLTASLEKLKAAGHEAQGIVVDLARIDQIQAAFASVLADGHRLELVVHDVASGPSGGFLEMTPEDLEKSWINACRSGFVIGQHAIKIMLEQPVLNHGRGTYLLTGSEDSLRGQAGRANDAHARAGLRMLGQALAREYGPQCIHVAHIMLARALASGACDRQDAAKIAETYWNIYQQHRSTWTQEIDLHSWPEAN